MSRLVALVLVLGATGCGGDDESALHGVYAITAWTQNPDACTEGPSILPQQDMALYVKNENEFGTRFLNVMLCRDVAECAERSSDGEVHVCCYTFDRGSDAAGWEGGSFAGGADAQGNCSGFYFDYSLTSPSSGEVRIESRMFPVEGFQWGDRPSCLDGAREAAETSTCTAHELLTATFDSAIPPER